MSVITHKYLYRVQSIMDEFDINAFTAKPTLLVLDSLKKTDLLAIAQLYKLSTQKKGDVKKLVREYLVDEEKRRLSLWYPPLLY